ncbi:MAG TPA: hypothetical protein VMG74_09070 [Gaiellaceae bacterium]|nr:hypothetical protein [Gaiellaceae bacterium]
MNAIVPASLAGYRAALEEAIRRDLEAGRARPRRGVAVRVLLAAAVVAALALGTLSLVSRQASGATVIRRAAAAIARSPGTILHVELVGSQNNPDGSVVTWRDESWQQESPPYYDRQIETAPDGSVAETAESKDGEELYDPKTNTIYVSAASAAATPPTFRIERGSRPGTFVLRLHPAPKAGAGVVSVRPLPLSARQVKALRNGTDVIAWRVSKKSGRMSVSVTVIPGPKHIKRPVASTASSVPDPDPTSAAFRDQILALLSSGGAQVVGHRTIDGRDVIEIDSADGHTTYFVDPGSYAPVELRTRGDGGGTTLRFPTYQKLELDGNASLLSLGAQHPTARVDRDPADYQAAMARLFPRG